MTDGMEIDNGLLGDDHNTSMMLGNNIVMRKRYTSTHLEKKTASQFTLRKVKEVYFRQLACSDKLDYLASQLEPNQVFRLAFSSYYCTTRQHTDNFIL